MDGSCINGQRSYWADIIRRKKNNWEPLRLYHVDVLLYSKRGGEKKSIEHERRGEDIHT
jgi:hypothetical protein